MINDNQRLVGAKSRFGRNIRVYDDGFGPLFIHRDSMGICGIVRAQTWEDAYGICEDEFFPSADEEHDDWVKEYGENYPDDGAWQEAFGYRPNGKGGPTPDKDNGIYAKDLNGDYLDVLTDKLLKELEITLQIETEE